MLVVVLIKEKKEKLGNGVTKKHFSAVNKKLNIKIMMWSPKKKRNTKKSDEKRTTMTMVYVSQRLGK